MSKSSKYERFSEQPPLIQLERIVAALNGEPGMLYLYDLMEPESFRSKTDAAMQQRLNILVGEWMDSGRNMLAFKKKNETSWAMVDLEWRNQPPILEPTKNGVVRLRWVKGSKPSGDLGSHWKSDRDAVRLFIMLILNSQWMKLEGPCDRCKRYYIRKRIANKLYCSLKCRRSGYAIEATKKSRIAERKDKLCVAKELSGVWIKTNTRIDWKHWIAKKSNGYLSTRWITRAVSKRDLIKPDRPAVGIRRKVKKEKSNE